MNRSSTKLATELGLAIVRSSTPHRSRACVICGVGFMAVPSNMTGLNPAVDLNCMQKLETCFARTISGDAVCIAEKRHQKRMADRAVFSAW